MICDHIGRLISYCITNAGNVDDRKVLPDLIEHSQLTGKLFGDLVAMWVRDWRSRLAEVGVQLITRVKKYETTIPGCF